MLKAKYEMGDFFYGGTTKFVLEDLFSILYYSGFDCDKEIGIMVLFHLILTKPSSTIQNKIEKARQEKRARFESVRVR